ncbi:MAG TPA: gamma-glutamylcyclotransferase [Chromatiaceae bacterium]|jgi:gamma-glutamylaminecyclotransferase|nr:MAG: hypothetical protein N838_05640 [Thiohalocapsa sp. PB-PSB1]QQO56976.1 MAG: gamma-glutamylcyclotransferase [Thiohalocapsa sp. PB-PSB1]HBG97083.1 gamma-glutamylcyclotransferase [Chromatiaceae bacterium]HCS89831.1 gamma-glutamylcyclotransferase [Chromatiaceae bacterium]
MEHRVFVYGTLLRGEANHGLLAKARFLGAHQTKPCFRMLLLGAYPGLVAGGSTAIAGEVYSINQAILSVLDRLEDYPRLYDRRLIPTPYGPAWLYLYRGKAKDRPTISSGNWRDLTRSGKPLCAAAVRNRRDSKNPSRQFPSPSQDRGLTETEI